jgi:hypothetical protein
MLLLNTDPEVDTSPVGGDFHEVPTVHLKLEFRDAIRTYATTSGEHSQHCAIHHVGVWV